MITDEELRTLAQKVFVGIPEDAGLGYLARNAKQAEFHPRAREAMRAALLVLIGPSQEDL